MTARDKSLLAFIALFGSGCLAEEDGLSTEEREALLIGVEVRSPSSATHQPLLSWEGRIDYLQVSSCCGSACFVDEGDPCTVSCGDVDFDEPSCVTDFGWTLTQDTGREVTECVSGEPSLAAEVVYGRVPPGAIEDDPAPPLREGCIYEVYVSEAGDCLGNPNFGTRYGCAHFELRDGMLFELGGGT